MRIGIIGAGFTGLAAAYRLTKQGHTVTIFEKDPTPGGLAIGFQRPEWEWTLEKHYHHWFSNDTNVLSLAKEIGYPVLLRRPRTSVYVDGTVYQLDSPKSVLLFPKLTPLERFRMAAVLGFLKYNPFWLPLEKVNAVPFLRKIMGEHAYQLIWEPQFVSKFGSFAKEISLAWFWARIKKRTPQLAYPEKGFLPFAEALVGKIKEQHGAVYFNTEVTKLITEKETVTLHTKDKTHTFDRVLVTLPSFFFTKIAPDLPEAYKKNLLSLQGLGAINLVLRLKKDFLTDGTYWLSVCDKHAPVMAIVEHTHFMDRVHYNNETLVYLGNYLPQDHKYFSMTAVEILKIYDPFLKKINPDYEKNLIGVEAFKVPFAQPIIPLGYSKIVPPLGTPLKNVYLANMQQVYPWDRGTNYAVAFGEKAAEIMINEKKSS